MLKLHLNFSQRFFITLIPFKVASTNWSDTPFKNLQKRTQDSSVRPALKILCHPFSASKISTPLSSNLCSSPDDKRRPLLSRTFLQCRKICWLPGSGRHWSKAKWSKSSFRTVAECSTESSCHRSDAPDCLSWFS